MSNQIKNTLIDLDKEIYNIDTDRTMKILNEMLGKEISKEIYCVILEARDTLEIMKERNNKNVSKLNEYYFGMKKCGNCKDSDDVNIEETMSNPILTKEEMASIRARCDAAMKEIKNDNVCWRIEGSKRYVHKAISDISFLITALEAETKRADEVSRQVKIALKTCPNGGNDGYISPRLCQREMETLETDRDYW